MDRRHHWEQVYQTRRPDQVSWFQAEARLSRQLIEDAVPDRAASIIDIGAGASTLIEGLLAAGYQHLTVMDIAGVALDIARRRVGAAGAGVTWRADDVLTATFKPAAYDLWHDRAVFHFLTEAGDRARYVAQVRRAVRPGGLVLIATFADDGPTRCSGLEVVRYSPSGLHAAFGPGFQLLASRREEHHTPWDAIQAFTYCLCRFDGPGAGQPGC